MRRGGRFDMGAGRYSRQPAGPSYGPELITNGGFASGDNWTLDGDPLPPVIALDKLHSTASDINTATQNIGSQTAGTYHLVYTIDSISPGCAVNVDFGAGSIARTTAGTFTEDVVANVTFTDIPIQMTNPPDVGTVIDNISIKKVL